MADDESDVERFSRLLAWSYRAEIAGEALFAELAVGFEATGHRALLEDLAEVERLMADALRPALHRYGVDGGDDERSRAQGRANAALAIEDGWDTFLARFDPITEAALAKYVELRSLCERQDPVWDLLIAHEEALQVVGRILSGDGGGDAQAPVNVLLERLRAHAAAPA
ncbi:MAG TPA: hypothetical protein VNO51_04055 [Ilumatobacteraceae bacterium]|nr:hypothetical protein [Ilumatobacteraceae bacterium]